MNEQELIDRVAVILQRVKYVKLGESLEPIAEEIIDLVRDDQDGRLERFTRVAMLGAMAIEEIPHIQGVLAVAAYEKWSHTWLTTLTSDDMTYARGVMGLPEPEAPDADYRTCEIVVNGQVTQVPGDLVTYHDVVALAFPGLPSFTSTPYTITYRNARNPKEGILTNGEAVEVAERGTVFNVVVIG